MNSVESQPLRANFQKNYLTRYMILAGVCMFLGCWFAYDGLVGYPAKLDVAREYEKLAELDDQERFERWNALTTEKGWSSSLPEKSAQEIEEDIPGQYFWAAINLIVGVPALLLLLRSRGSWVESTPDGLKTSWGQTVDFATVSQLDKKKWASKGIARATYMDGTTQRTFTFDDFKFEREPLGQMLRKLEAILKPEQIVNGLSEVEADLAKAAAAEKAAAEEAATEDSAMTESGEHKQ